MTNIICVECQVEMCPLKNGCYVIEMEDGGVFWSKEQVLRAMEAAFKAGRRSRDKE